MTNMSRRSVAKGAAWSVPAMAVATAAPVMAASNEVLQSCPTASTLTLQGGTAKPFISSIEAGNGTYSGGTAFSIASGSWVVPAGTATNGNSVTGYYLLIGQCGLTSCSQTYAPGTEVPVTNGSGTKYKGKVGSSTPTGCSPQTAGAGLTSNITLQTSIPYTALICNSAQNLVTISVPITVIYLNGLTPVYDSSGVGCCYYLNMKFNTGCSPQTSSAYSITNAPLYA